MTVKQWLFDFSAILVAVMIAEVIIIILQSVRTIPTPSSESPLGSESRDVDGAFNS